ncbi:hypothetical protein HHK36_022960 [Tetracentron sinense]|uniref:Uncharacterized protein n=1 Tax=Tetracentron sinense TaxID=13715 RepID=A0A835D6J5_TETSI|nr:hypothetical protein HHK36_022960 [Tetracentron sinense]
MWRQNTFPENRDSDQSISDEEELNHDPSGNSKFLSRIGKNKKQTGSSPEDMVEMPVFNNGERASVHSSMNVFTNDEEGISKEENNVPSPISIISKANKFQKDHIRNHENENEDRACTWPAVLKEADELVFLHENAGSSSSHATNSKVRKIWKGNRGKAKPKFSIRFQSHKEEPSWPFMEKDDNDKLYKVAEVPLGLEVLEHRIMEHSMTELLEGLQEEKEKLSGIRQVPSELIALTHQHTEHSMADLLECLQEEKGPLKGTSKLNSRTKGRSHLTAQRNTSSLGDRTLDDEDPPEPIGSGTSSEDEDVKCVIQINDQNQLKLAIPDTNRQTMADRFLEALSAATETHRGTLFEASKCTGMEYHGRLQQVMQSEKERHLEFLKQLETGANSHNEVRCIDVKILSRYLNAKLTVCCCSFGENNKNLQCAESPQQILEYGGKEKTIIFSSRICGDVELEVGNSIRIHPPWNVMIIGDSPIVVVIFLHLVLTVFGMGSLDPSKGKNGELNAHSYELDHCPMSTARPSKVISHNRSMATKMPLDKHGATSERLYGVSLHVQQPFECLAFLFSASFLLDLLTRRLRLSQNRPQS